MTNIYAQYGRVPAFTPPSLPIPGREAEMIPNNAGGQAFIMDDWARLHRFLILGSDGGTYYVDQKDLTKQNADVVIRCIKADGVRAVEAAHAVNVANRAPKVDQQLFVLALALKHGDQATKNRVAALAPDMLRIGTHVLHFAAMLDGLGGWNRTKRRILAKWFTERPPYEVAYQAVKYAQRDGFAQRDLLRLAHPLAPSNGHRAVFEWMCGRATELPLPAIVCTKLAVEKAEGDAVERALFGIANGLPREALPTEALNDKRVMAALLPQMPPHALIRNLGSMTAEGADLADAVNRLRDRDVLRKARVHPFAIMLAAAIYKTGHGLRGGKRWTPLRAVLEALDDAYEVAFDLVEPTNKRILIAIDGSGSMSAPCIGTPLPCEDAAAMMALALARPEPHARVVVFETEVRKVIPITKRSALSSISYEKNPAATDLSAPIRWAMGEGVPSRVWRPWSGAVPNPAQQAQRFDAFILLSDHETWAGRGHPVQFLAEYRRKVNPGAKLIVCAFAANHANVVDPADPLQLGAAGLDANLPSIVSEFIGG